MILSDRFRMPLVAGVVMLSLAEYAYAQQPDATSAAEPVRALAPMVDGKLQACQQTRNQSEECRLLERKLSDIKKPQPLDEFLSNLKWLIYTNTLVKPEFYNSDEAILRVLGGDRGDRIRDSGDDGFYFQATIVNKGIFIGSYGVEKSSNGSYGFGCDSSFLFALSSRNHDLRKSYTVEIAEGEHQQKVSEIYYEIINYFLDGWERLDQFYHERRIKLPVFYPPPPPTVIYDKSGKPTPVDVTEWQKMVDQHG